MIPIANNGDFAINALDNLAGSEGLISLRGRGLIDRPFEVVRAMEQEAEYKYRAKEQELLSRIDETEAKIRKLKEEEQKSGVILTAAEQQEIDSFRGEMIRLRQELRGVQRSCTRTWRSCRPGQGAQHLGRAGADRVGGRGSGRLQRIGPRARPARQPEHAGEDATMSPKAFLVLAAVTVVTTVAAVFAILASRP